MPKARPCGRPARGPTTEDGLWLRQVAAGDEAALRRLYDLHADTFYALGLRLLQSPTEAQDAVQDAFIRIWRSAATWDEARSSAFTWMVMLQRRACIDRLRARGRHERLFSGFGEEAGQELVEFISPESVTANNERVSLQDAVRGLPPEQREVIELAFYQGLTHAEIARSRREPLGTIKARLRRAMLRLRTFLQERYD
jgi:RNA polymerase sigma-70 factor, ECF subfamily